MIHRWNVANRFLKNRKSNLANQYQALYKAWYSHEYIINYDEDYFAEKVIESALSISQNPKILERDTPTELRIFELIKKIVVQEGVYHIPKLPENLEDISEEQRVYILGLIEAKTKQLNDMESALASAMNGLGTLVAKITDLLPRPHEPKSGNVLIETDLKGIIYGDGFINKAIYALNAQEAIDSYGYFQDLAKQYFDGCNLAGNQKKPIEIDQFNGTLQEKINQYFSGSFIEELYELPITINIPQIKRFEHTHIIGKSGHGKTQLIQYLLAHDIPQALQNNCSIVVIDSQKDMIEKITQVLAFDPDPYPSFAEKLVIVDPTDPSNPPALNLFDFSEDKEDMSTQERERMANATVELYEYILSSLLDSELTNKQGVLFKNLARLMMKVPHATLKTLLDFLEGERLIEPHLSKLDEIPRRFFETQFNNPQFKETKEQIVWRLHDIFSQSGFEKMFNNPENKINFPEAINQGKIILINTATDYLGDFSSRIFGRFFVALLAQTVAQRASIPENKRLPCYAYIDEASEYFDEKIKTLIHKARKQKVGLTLAHQELNQLSPSIQNAILTCGTKFIGRLPHSDMLTMLKETNGEKETLENIKKVDYKFAEYGFYLSDQTPKLIKTQIPFGIIENDEKMTVAQHNKLKHMKKLELIGKSKPETLEAPKPPKDDFGEPELL